MAYLLDLDGTLVDSRAAYFAAWQTILTSFGMELSDCTYSQYIDGKSDSEVLRTLLHSIEDDVTLEQLSATKDSNYGRHLSKVKEIDGALSFLEACKGRGIQIAVVTNSNRCAALLVLEYLNMLQFVDEVVSSSDVSHPKPSPEPYIEAARRLGTDIRRCLAFEDSKTGLRSAAEAGVGLVIGVSSSMSPGDMLKCGAHDCIASFAELSCSRIADVFFKIKIQICLSKLRIDNMRLTESHWSSDKSLRGGYISNILPLSGALEDGQEVTAILKLQSGRLSLEEEFEYDLISSTANVLELFERECCFYETISSSVPIRVPRYLGALKDEGDRAVGLALEDLRSADWSLDIRDVAERVLRDLALLHRTFRGCSALPGLSSDLLDKKYSTVICERYDAFVSLQAAALKESHLELLFRIRRNFETLALTLACSTAHTLCHGDFKVGNMCQLTNGQVCYLDWQYATIGPGARDLAFFLIESSASTHDWPNWIGLYHSELGVSEYSYQRLIEDLRLSSLVFPFFVAIWFGSADASRLRDPSFPSRYIEGLLRFYDYFDVTASSVDAIASKIC